MQCDMVSSWIPNPFHSASLNSDFVLNASASSLLVSSVPMAGFSVLSSVHFKPDGVEAVNMNMT